LEKIMQAIFSLSRAQRLNLFGLLAEVAVVFAMVVFATNTFAQTGNVYDGGQRAQSVLGGTVVSIREVTVNPSTRATQVGTATGAAFGGAVGYALAKNTKNTSARMALGILGAGLGGLGGSAVADRMGQNTAIEIVVAIPTERGNPRLMAVVQPLPAPQVGIGQAVLVLNDRGVNRIIPQAQPVAPITYQAPAVYQVAPQAYPVAMSPASQSQGYPLPGPYESAD
jgi:outer membrane lipoprotein SlyB